MVRALMLEIDMNKITLEVLLNATKLFGAFSIVAAMFAKGSGGIIAPELVCALGLCLLGWGTLGVNSTWRRYIGVIPGGIFLTLGIIWLQVPEKIYILKGSFEDGIVLMLLGVQGLVLWYVFGTPRREARK